LWARIARRELGDGVRRLGRGGGRLVQQRADAGEGRGAAAIAEHPIVANVLKAFGEVVEEEAPQEFDGVERHRAVLVPVGIVLLAEGDLAVRDGHQALVADGDPWV
jgi:hypothetical protein